MFESNNLVSFYEIISVDDKNYGALIDYCNLLNMNIFLCLEILFVCRIWLKLNELEDNIIIS